ncbi:MAG: demethylmenaquinone methyltransferase / 2-methoxy-6-polyprenyl,4-benzoquinol methylase [Actinomycetota bacterium]|nr:demethylmenaquinone methyltransferase / 2-methoxy-6-polyprenyl,4-benzoquinol methylase [Actinomycetota bacterium]
MQTTATDPNRFAQDLFRALPRRYDLLEELLSLGQNRRWRHEMVAHVDGGDPKAVLDVATGTAGVALVLTHRTRAQIVGIDITEAMLRRGHERISRVEAAGRVRLVVGQAERLPFPDNSFDALTFTYLLRYVADPAATLRELARVLKPGGAIASLEFAVPANPFWWFWWWLYTRGVLPVAGYVTGGREWSRVGRFLGPNISAHYRRYPVPWTKRAWEDAGFVNIGVRSMSLGGGLVMWAQKHHG